MHGWMDGWMYVCMIMYVESSPLSWEGAGPATARGAEPYRSHAHFEIGGSRQLAARSRFETVPFGSDLGRPQYRNGRCPPHEKNISQCHSLAFSKGIIATQYLSKASQKLMFAALGFTPSQSKSNFQMKTVKKH